MRRAPDSCRKALPENGPGESFHPSIIMDGPAVQKRGGASQECCDRLGGMGHWWEGEVACASAQNARAQERANVYRDCREERSARCGSGFSRELRSKYALCLAGAFAAEAAPTGLRSDGKHGGDQAERRGNRSRNGVESHLHAVVGLAVIGGGIAGFEQVFGVHDRASRVCGGCHPPRQP